MNSGEKTMVNSSDGWKERIYIPTAIAGIIGAGAGLVSKHRKAYGVANLSATYAANLAIVNGCYCGLIPEDLSKTMVVFFILDLGLWQNQDIDKPTAAFLEAETCQKLTFTDVRVPEKSEDQIWAKSLPSIDEMGSVFRCRAAREFVREARASEPGDLINSLIGGIASGALLGRLQGGRLGAIRYSIIFAVAGTSMDFTALQLKSFLHGSGDATTTSLDSPQEKSEKSIWHLPEWSPIQVLDDEALAAKQAREQRLYGDRSLGKLNKEES